jgi:hypothetical protein
MTHVWPTSDDFAAGSTAYGDWPSAYLKAAWWSAASFAHPVLSSYTSTVSASDLTDAFSKTQGADASSATPSTDPSGYLWRPLESNADGTVRMAFNVRVLTGVPLVNNGMTIGMVCARVSGSTYTSATNSHSAIQNGYFFGWLGNSSGLGCTWYLVRVNSGSRTILQSSTFATAAGSSSSNFDDLFKSRSGEVYLTVEASGSDVRLRGGYRRGVDTTDTQVFDVTDTSGSKITTAGRYGFAMNGAVTVTGGDFAAQCSRFEVVEGSTVRVRDEWQRAFPLAALQSTPKAGFTGRSLLQSWCGDFHGVAAYDQKLWRSKVGGLTDRINVKPDTEPTGNATTLRGSYMPSQRRATDRRSQNRTITFRFSSLQQGGSAGTTNPTAQRAVGISLRGSMSLEPAVTNTGNFVGYSAVIRINDGAGTAVAQLYRFTPSQTLLADKAVTAAVDTDYTLRFDAYNLLDASSNNTGAVVMRVYLGGVQIAFDAVDPNVTVTAAGNVIDGTSSRIIEGSLECLNVFTVNGDKTTFVDTWTESTLTNASGTAASAQASIAVAGEADSDSGQTFTVPYDWGVEEIAGQMYVTVPFESGHRNNRNAHTAGRRRWKIRAGAITEDERDDLLTFWDAHNGCEKAFTFAPPYGGASVKAHFADDTLGSTLRDRGVFAYEIEIEELFA